MEKTKVLRVVAILIIAVLSLSFTGSPVKAIDLTPTTGSLTITKREKGKGLVSGVYPPLAGVEFKIYKVSDTETSTNATVTSSDLKGTEITGANGQVTFSGLELRKIFSKRNRCTSKCY